MTKNKLKIILFAFSLTFGIIGFVFQAQGGNVSFTTDTDILLTGSNITVKALTGSQADSVAVGTTTITVTITNPDTFTIRSYNRYDLVNNAGIVQQCTATYSQLIIDQYPGTRVVTVTPSTNICSSAGGGGGGGGVIDTTPPTNTSIVIASGAATTSTTAVTLTLSATDATQMMISNASDFAGATWETYTTSKSWTLTSGDGVKTVYAKFRDAAGNASSPISDTITLSTPVDTSNIIDGDVVKTANNPDVYVVKYVGSKKFKRLILNPKVFESYKHLKWGNIKTVTQSQLDSFTTSDLVRADKDYKVYKLTPNGDVGTKQWLNMTAADFVTRGYDWDSIYIINSVDRDNYTTGTDIK